MPEFRKRAVVVTAHQFKRDAPMVYRDPFNVVNYGVPKAEGDTAPNPLDGKHWLQTLEGPLIVSDGDWIIKGTAGEFYPCKPDIFVTIYDPVEAAMATQGNLRAPQRARSGNAPLEESYRHHPPFGTQPARYEALRQKGLELAKLIEFVCPPSRERSAALTELELAIMLANKAIAVNEAEITPTADTVLAAAAIGTV